jgi:hypothetical protein
MVRTFLEVYMELGSYFLFLQEQIKGIIISTHVDDCLISCKSTATMSKFKQELLTRFQGTDEGEVKEYLGCQG